MAWAYNWASSPGGTIGSGLDYVPMLWGAKSVGTWQNDATKAVAAGAKYLLSFNEPDLAAQANMSPSDAAAAHIKNMNPFSGQAKIGSPAVTNGGGNSPPMGTVWLQQFFDACAGKCKVDFVTFHWYESATNTQYFKNHAQDIINVATKNGVNKVWLTEFGASGSDTQVASFLGDVLPWLDGKLEVERYAYFMCNNGILLSGGQPSTIGKAYAA